MKLKNLFVITGLLSIATGLVYLLGFYGPTEAEIKQWAMLAVLAGVLSIIFSGSNSKKISLNVMAVLGYSLLFIAQIFPIYMWFTSPMLSDKQSDFAMSYWYSIPHFLLGMFVFLSVVKIVKSSVR